MTPARPQFLFFMLIFIITLDGNDAVLCPKIEKQALLSFKHSVKYSSTNTAGHGILFSWTAQTDCCTWEGVVCSNLTGHVLELHLQDPSWDGDLGLYGKLDDDSLLTNLIYLEYLDLSENMFQGTIPAFIGSFAKLQYLNVSSAGFDVDDLKWLSRLSSLEHLDMSNVDLSKEVNWLKVINTLPSLVELRLRSSGLNGKLGDSLLHLRHLRHLDLSYNDFEGPIPAFIGSFSKLEYLELSEAGFKGTIPHVIGNLSSLRTLVLRGIDMDVDSLEWLSGLSHLEHLGMSYLNLSKAINWLQVINTLPSLLELNFKYCSLFHIEVPLNTQVNFSSLSILDLSNNNFRFVPTWIFQLSQLTHLDLGFNHFQQGVFPSAANFTKLRYISFSDNNFESIPDWLYDCKYLEHIFAGFNSMQGSIPGAIGNIATLQHLDLSNNEFSGEIPGEISKLCNMQFLDLSYNKFHGDISNAFENMSDCFSMSLEILMLERNNLSGRLPDKFGELKSLRWFTIGRNSLSGPIPESIGQLFNLEMFTIGYNMLEGVVTETHFANLTNLDEFSASRNNNLTLKVGEKWIPPFKASVLQLGSWNLGSDGQIPTWIHTQKANLENLDLSDTGLIAFHIPSWFLEIRFLNLSHNQLHGKIPNLINSSHEGPQYMFLSNNLISGSLPRVSSSVYALDLSNNLFSGGLSPLLCGTTYESYQLQFLHLGGNLLLGELPNCWAKWRSLIVLNLGNNNLSGRIPKTIGFLEDLRVLDLYNNKLSGNIPYSMQSCSRLMKIDATNNELVGKIPAWLSISLTNLRILILRANKLTGKISSSICYLDSLQILDLSHNMFYGIIPRCVDNFTAMATGPGRLVGKDDYYLRDWYFSFNLGIFFVESASVSTRGRMSQYDTILHLVTNIDLSSNNLSGDIPKQLTSLVELRSLNLSRNHLRGLIPNGIGDMKQLESLDLSRNSLSGEIPSTMSVLSLINYLDLSYNNFTGRIPQSTQITTLPASGFIGNKLCGPPLPTDCDDGGGNDGLVHEEEDVHESEVEWLYVFFSLGYAVGLSVICNTLIFKKSWMDAFFGLVDNMWNKFYVYFSKKRNRRR